MNPAPIPSCGIVVPLGESWAPSLRHLCAVRGSKRRCSAGKMASCRKRGSAPYKCPRCTPTQETANAVSSPIRERLFEPKARMEGKGCKNDHCNKDLLPVLFIIAVLPRCSGVPVPGGVAAVTGGTDSEDRQLTNRTITTITRPLSESRSTGLAFDFKAPP